VDTVKEVGAPVGAPTRRGRRPGARLESSWAWAFVAPTLLGVLVFYIWPILRTAYFSFTKWGAFGNSINWVGLANYQRLIADPYLGRSVLNTLIYTAIVLCAIPIAIVFASLINRPGLRFATLYRVAFFMPYVAMPTAIALIWRMIYNGDFGILNYVLSWFGIEGPAWVSTKGYALVAVGVLGLWSSLGFIMIVLSAGLKSIPPDLYEAASLDGASRWKQFWHVTVPLLTPSIFFVTVMTVIGGFQLFDLLFALMGGKGNPAMIDTQSLVYLFYNNAFILNDKGYASAIAMVILALVGAVTALQFRMQRRWVNYD
jgi:multiple sugar transport system permease protein